MTGSGQETQTVQNTRSRYALNATVLMNFEFRYVRTRSVRPTYDGRYCVNYCIVTATLRATAPVIRPSLVSVFFGDRAAPCRAATERVIFTNFRRR